MPHVHWRDLVGQERVKDTLARAMAGDALGHAYLFCGDAGVGKFQAALELSLALLCNDSAAVPCYRCESCRQVLHHAHPDFQMVLPVCLQKEHKASDGKLSERGWGYLDEVCRGKVADPYRLNGPAGIATIPVEWIREVNHSILRGSVKQRRNAAIICGIDLMKKESANAMLRTLEEPPENTVIILITERPYAVLPTIVSRCQIMRFGYVDSGLMTEALGARYGMPSDDARVQNAVRCAEGSLGKARQLLEQPLDELLAEAETLLELCAATDWNETAVRLDALLSQRLDFGREYGRVERILTYVIYRIRDSFLRKAGVSGKYIREAFASHAAAGASCGPDTASRILAVCQDAIDAVRARGNVQLVLTTFLLSMMEIFHGKEQPAR
ncbi:MAG: hypothetical protein GF418_05185 [Chitinivibrionales bacterium]|nr:hypothetical protein [Chitinivibrionales bacterium]MBD3395004.1 hypothetical protein [Chitinivibrionales bacterium]